MAPISWLILFFIFSFSFILFNIMNYFCFFNSIKNNEICETNKNMNSNNNNKTPIINMNWMW